MSTQTLPVIRIATKPCLTRTAPHGAIRVAIDERDAKVILWEALKSQRLSQIVFRQNYGIAHLTVDFFAHKFHLVVSVNERGYSSRHWAYAKQDAQLRHLGYRVLRFTEEEIRRELPNVLDSIVEVASQIARKQRRI